MIEVKNIYHTRETPDKPGEVFEDLVRSGETLIERIISTGQSTPEGSWYDQEQDEWVILLQGEATLLVEGSGTLSLKAGDFILIPAHCRHRVLATTKSPACVWLAIHGILH